MHRVPRGVPPKKIPTAMPSNVWTNVELIWTKDGLVKILFNSMPVLETNAFSTASTSASATLGLVPVGTAPAVPRHAYDNFVVSVKR